jgi:RimJ/RimL family protein N-acetyltransferase
MTSNLGPNAARSRRRGKPRGEGGSGDEPGQDPAGLPHRRRLARAGASGVFPRWQRPHLPAEALAARTPERNLAEWEGILTHIPERATILVAEIDQRLVGVAGAGPARDQDLDPAMIGKLYTLYVHPEAWGNGFGSAVHQAAMRYLVAEGFGSSVLWVLDGNHRARRLNERRGWRADGRRADEAGAPKLRYRLQPLGEREPGRGSPLRRLIRGAN